MDPHSPSGAEMITVRIGEQLFAFDIMQVREIRGWTSSTPMPHAPDYMLGVINLRGSVLPVLNLGLRLGLQTRLPDPSSVVIVADLGERVVGLLVDAVCDIVTVAPDALQPVPHVGEACEGFVRAIFVADEELVSVLQFEQILHTTDLAA